MNLVLASQSPRRRELLGVLGIPFTVIHASVDETPSAGEDPKDYVIRVARDKATDAATRVSNSVILSADTDVTIDGEILGKPATADDAVRMLKKLSGRCHSVYTAVCVINQTNRDRLEGVDQTKVWFDDLTDRQIREYIRREDVMDKAGAYAIQGYAGLFIPKIEGNYFNVMGLPLPLVYQLLCRTSS